MVSGKTSISLIILNKIRKSAASNKNPPHPIFKLWAQDRPGFHPTGVASNKPPGVLIENLSDPTTSATLDLQMSKPNQIEENNF